MSLQLINTREVVTAFGGIVTVDLEVVQKSDHDSRGRFDLRPGHPLPVYGTTTLFLKPLSNALSTKVMFTAFPLNGILVYFMANDALED
jgi:uncharacterized membrane protein